MTKRVDVSVCIGRIDGVEDTEGAPRIAVSVFLPAVVRLATRPVVMFGLPGGGYSRGYYDLRFDKYADYSQADYHCQRGCVFVSIDHLGVGDSSVPDLAKLAIEQIALAGSRAVESVTRMLVDGTLDEAFAPPVDPFRVGLGQSMGGCLGVVMQGVHRSFDAYAVLGYSVVNTALPKRPSITPESEPAGTVERGVDLAGISMEAARAAAGDFSYGFHWHDEPDDIVRADTSGGFPLRNSVPPFGSATTLHCATSMLMPGCVSREASMIVVPLFLGYGELDVSVCPHRDPMAYPGSRDISLHIVPRMAHMHNFASTRHVLWGLLQHWVDRLAAR